ncbi:M1 family peptidase [Sediminibacterium roseum]|uniref:Aminopeptidase N n=1 Tax=Sediminibacterium roseum TaxID=1978412 RepID=A0ABW9ZWI8_9BACT|nr:M1 family aminopeptidase [Sediminibacterium roseum]NCI51505.1 M1 family peptidase [Sediminibacterium roseum]
MKYLLSAFFVMLVCTSNAQPGNSSAQYRQTEEKINDLVHTKLELRFDYSKAWAIGKAWITLHPHFYPTDSLRLDAKGMTINSVSLVSKGKNIRLKFAYDAMNLRISLDKTYKGGENYTVFIDYIAKPNEYKAVHPSLMPGEKGLYFINNNNAIKNKPVQIWSQGETEANSYWFPTIDKPNQKTTNEITLTVPSKYTTLSNGLLTSQKTNSDGTRTDTWKMDLPHAPYLLFIGIGEYAVVKDKYKNKEVSYYVEKEYEPFARRIFGHTPEMIAFFSRITGVDFPWQKYAQITGRDYIFGAMENTTATLHEEGAQLDARQLSEGNAWEDIIAHELFHQWFGDYVTAESWSNTTVNESFADYSETLWNEYKYGKEAGQETIYNNRQTYFANPANRKLSLVRFAYDNAIEAFDEVSYQKGGSILHMLRNYVGDSAFFRSLNVYLSANKFGNGEVHQLRLAFEQVTGQDLNWFFNQWYYRPGNPKVDISYAYNNGSASVIFKQLQPDLFILPMAIDVYERGAKKRYQVWAKNAVDTFTFPVNGKPDFINVDADKVLVMEKTDNMSADNAKFQYRTAGAQSHIDRREAAYYFVQRKQAAQETGFVKELLKDKNPGIRSRTLINAVNMGNDTIREAMEPLVKELLQKDPSAKVRRAAITSLLKYRNYEAYKPLFIAAVSDSSYSVAGGALTAVSMVDSVGGLLLARSLMLKPAKGELLSSIVDKLASYGDDKDFAYVYDVFEHAGTSARFGLLDGLATALTRTKDAADVRKQVDVIIDFRDGLPAFLASGVPQVNGYLKAIAQAQRSMGNAALADYIETKLPK